MASMSASTAFVLLWGSDKRLFPWAARRPPLHSWAARA